MENLTFTTDSTEFKWWLASATPHIQMSNDSADNKLAELYPDQTQREFVQQAVADYWQISNREEALSTIRSLIHTDYIGLVWQEYFALRACNTEHQWRDKVTEEAGKDKIHSEELRFIDATYRLTGTGGFKGWDIARGSLLVRQCFYLDWISEQELQFLLNLFSVAVQRNFSNWQQYISSYVYGRMVAYYLNDRNEGEAAAGMAIISRGGYNPGYSYLFQTLSSSEFSSLWEFSMPELEVPDSLTSEKEEQ